MVKREWGRQPMREVKTAWRVWWGWSPEKIENWLEEMAWEGWTLFQVDFASLRFKFSRGKAEKVRYCVDYQEKTDDDYMKLFKDDGWELAWSGAFGWHIWRKYYSGEKPDIYTDRQSLIDRNKRLIGVGLPVFIVLTLFLILSMFVGNWISWSTVTGTVVAAIYGCFLVKLLHCNKTLSQNRIRE